MARRIRLTGKAKEQFRQLGHEGGTKAAQGMSKEARSERARKAAETRWRKVRQKSNG
jgi:hypothetical protein